MPRENTFLVENGALKTEGGMGLLYYQAALQQHFAVVFVRMK